MCLNRNLMNRVLQIVCIAILPMAWMVHANDLQVARAALQDQLYGVAQNHAERVLADNHISDEAFLILMRALAEQGRYNEILQRLESADNTLLQVLPQGAAAFWRVTALMRLQRQSEAALAAKEALSAGGVYTDALRRLAARALRESKNYEAALTMFAQIDKTTTNQNERADNALEWAAALHEAKQENEALDILKMQADLNATTDSIYDGMLLRGRILMAQGKSGESISVLKQLAMSEHAAESAYVQAMLEMSAYALQSGTTNEAVAYARSAWERAKKSETRRVAGFYLGDLLCADTSTIDEGENIVKALVREFPEHPASASAQLKLANSLLQAKRPERADTEYRIFLETYPSSSLDATVLQGRGWALLQLGRYAESGLTFQRATQLATNESVKAECTFKHGDALLADKRFAEASRVYREMAEKYPNDHLADQALYQSADALVRAGMVKEATSAWRKVVETFPRRDVAPKALLRLAELQTEAGDSDNAINTYNVLLKAYAQHPLRTAALLGRGKIHYRAYRFEMAMQDFAAAAESSPDERDEAHFMTTLCLYGLGRDDEARLSAAAFMAFPESKRLPEMSLWLGKLDFNRGHYEDARRTFIDYATRWPERRWADAALLWAARAAFAANDFTSAIELVSRLARSYPQSTRMNESLLIQADALIELARFDEAVLLLDQTLTKTSESETLRIVLLRKGDALFAMGAGNSVRYREAMESYQQLLTQGSLTPSLTLQLNFKIGRCLEKLKQTSEAIDQYYAGVMVRYLDNISQGIWYDERSTTLFVRAAFTAAELYVLKGQKTEAAQVLQRVVQSGVPGADEARKRIERLRGSKGGEL